MRELIANPGLKSYLFNIRGLLTCTHTRNGKEPNNGKIHMSDIDDEGESDSGSTEDTAKLKSGVDASAVGIQFLLIKNDGLLEL